VKRVFIPALIATFAAPLLLLSLFLTVAQQADPALAFGGSPDVGQLLEEPGVTFSPNAQADLEAGLVDARLVSLLSWLSQRHSFYIGVFQTGHHKHVRGTARVSNHWYGRAADISIVDGVPVSSSNLAARRMVLEISGLQGLFRPSEVGHPFGSLLFPGGFTDADHLRHIHIGFRD
jgi:hypothetical protein